MAWGGNSMSPMSAAKARRKSCRWKYRSILRWVPSSMSVPSAPKKRSTTDCGSTGTSRTVMPPCVRPVRAWLDGLERVDLHARVDHRVLTHEAVVAEHDPLFTAGALAQIRRAPDHAAAQAHAIAEVGVVVDHRALDEGLVAHDHVGAEDAVLVQVGAGLHLAVVADD